MASTFPQYDCDIQVQSQTDRIKELEAQLAKVADTLSDIIIWSERSSLTRCLARIALAELKGESHE